MTAEKEDTSIDDIADDWVGLPPYRPSWRLRLRWLWQGVRCVALGHKMKQEGGKYWTDYGYEYDAWWECERCGKQEA